MAPSASLGMLRVRRRQLWRILLAVPAVVLLWGFFGPATPPAVLAVPPNRSLAGLGDGIGGGQLFIGLDMSTQSLKCTVLSADLAVVHTAAVGFGAQSLSSARDRQLFLSMQQAQGRWLVSHLQEQRSH